MGEGRDATGHARVAREHRGGAEQRVHARIDALLVVAQRARREHLPPRKAPTQRTGGKVVQCASVNANVMMMGLEA